MQPALLSLSCCASLLVAAPLAVQASTTGELKDLATDARPTDAAGFAKRCAERTKARQWKDALADCNEAIRLDPQLAGAWVERCRARVGLNEDLTKAMADCQEGVRLDPNSSRAYLRRGDVKAELKDHKGAIADYDKAIALYPYDLDDQTNRAHVKQWPGDQSGAVSDAKRVLSRNQNPDYVWGHVYYDEILFLQDKPQEACANFSKGLATEGLENILRDAEPALDAGYLKQCSQTP